LVNGDGDGSGTVDAGDYVMWRKNKPPAAGAASAIATGDALTSGAVAQAAVVAKSQPSVTAPAFPFAPLSAVIATASPIVDSTVSTTNVPVLGVFSFDQALLALASTEPSPASSAPATFDAAATDSAFDELSTLSNSPPTIDGRLSAIPTESAAANIWESL
jgi:hypothetical protein